MPTHTYTANNGDQVTIERNADGSFTVSDNAGSNPRTYGQDVAVNIYKDWDLSGVDLSASGVPPES